MEPNRFGFDGVAFVQGSVEEMCPEFDCIVGRHGIEDHHGVVDDARDGGFLVVEDQPFEPCVEADGVEALGLLVPAD